MACVSFFHPTFWVGNKAILSDLFNIDNLKTSGSKVWQEGSTNSLLFSSLFIRHIIFFCMITSPIANGIFAPNLVMGGIIGRIFANVSNSYFGTSLSTRIFSVSGAAAYAAVTSKTTSPILILLEMTGEMEYLLGLLVTVLVSNSVAGIYTMSMFDTNLNLRRYSSAHQSAVPAQPLQLDVVPQNRLRNYGEKP